MSIISTLRWILPALMAVSAVVHALPEDREKPIHIKADFADIDEGAGSAVYTGDVVMTQGTIKITGQKVTIHSDDSGVTRMIAEGAPAHYQEKPSIDEALIKAYGDTIDYSVSTEEIQILNNAKLYQREDSFYGDRVHYNMKTQIVNAKSDPTKDGSGSRVQMVIQPKKKK